MSVDEALNHADEWVKGQTFYPGAQGWRVVCAVLAAEVRRLRAEIEAHESEYKFSEGELKAAIGMSRRLYADQVNGLRVLAVEHSSLDGDEFIELVSKAKVLQILRGDQ